MRTEGTITGPGGDMKRMKRNTTARFDIEQSKYCYGEHRRRHKCDAHGQVVAHRRYKCLSLSLLAHVHLCFIDDSAAMIVLLWAPYSVRRWL